jgi:PiT family inorganic phosphate transporter
MWPPFSILLLSCIRPSRRANNREIFGALTGAIL